MYNSVPPSSPCISTSFSSFQIETLIPLNNSHFLSPHCPGNYHSTFHLDERGYYRYLKEVESSHFCTFVTDTPLSIMSSRLIYIVQHVSEFPPFLRQNNIPFLCIYHILFIHSSVDRNLQSNAFSTYRESYLMVKMAQKTLYCKDNFQLLAIHTNLC